MSTLYARKTAIVALVAAASLAGKEGFLYKLNESNQAVIVSAVTDTPHGVIGATTVDGLEISAIPLGGNHGTVRVKLGAAVTDLRKALQIRADGTVGPDAATGARTLVALPLETGAADELIECILISPRTITANAGVSIVALPVNLPSLANGDAFTNYTPGFAFELVAEDFRVTVPVTTAAKAATLNLEIGATNVTGGEIALTSANCTPIGAAVAGAAITAAFTGTATDTISIEASGVTTFIEGAGVVLLKIRNLETVNAG